MKRGDIRLTDFEPSQDSEANSQRPAIVISNDDSNIVVASRGHGIVTVVPVTTNVEKVHRFEIFLPSIATGLPHDSKAQAPQIRSMSYQRLGTLMGEMPTALMSKLDDALRRHLEL